MAYAARRGLAAASGFDEGLALGNASLRNISDESRDRIAIDHSLLVLRNFDNAVAQRLGATGRMFEALVAWPDKALRHDVGLDHLDPLPRLERREIIGGLLDLDVADHLGHGHHGTAKLPVAVFPVGHLADEIASRKPGNVGGFVVSVTGRKMAGAAGAHLRVLVPELD